MKNCHLIDTNNKWCFRVVEVWLFTGTINLLTVRLTSIYNWVPGKQEFCVAPAKEDYCRSGKNNSLSQLWHCLMLKTSQDMFHCRLINKNHRYLADVILVSK
jgi:hypothetical protein